jgi:hypothetical protein
LRFIKLDTPTVLRIAFYRVISRVGVSVNFI